MTLLSAAMARDVARSASEVARAISPMPADRTRADRCVAALVAFAAANADLPAPAWAGAPPNEALMAAIVQVTAAWPDTRQVEASAWQLVVSAVQLIASPFARRATG